MKQNIKYVGMTWYRREDYEKLRAIFTDANVLPSTFNKWLQLAEKGFSDLTMKGVTVEKVYIDLDSFPTWCRARGLNVDAKARVEFSNGVVARKYLGKDV